MKSLCLLRHTSAGATGIMHVCTGGEIQACVCMYMYVRTYVGMHNNICMYCKLT